MKTSEELKAMTNEELKIELKIYYNNMFSLTDQENLYCDRIREEIGKRI